MDPQDADAPEIEAELHRWQGEWLLARRESAAGEARHGLAAAARALGLNAKMAEALAERGALLRLQSRLEPSADRRAGLAAEAQAALRSARELSPLLVRDYPPGDGERPSAP